jgi:hypothetical protein
VTLGALLPEVIRLSLNLEDAGEYSCAQGSDEGKPPVGRLDDRRYGFMAAVRNESRTATVSGALVRQGVAVLNVL